MLYQSLLNNITLLVSLTVAHSLLLMYIKQGTRRFSVLSGMLFGAVTVTGMLISVELMPGIIFDGRSMVLVTAGVFGGPVPAVIAMLISALFRIILGGDGTLMGVLVIAESGILGIIFFYLRRRFWWARKSISYYLLAFAVHVIMLVFSVALPGGVAGEVIGILLLPVLLIYPLATLLLFRLFEFQERYTGLIGKLSESEADLQEANRMAVMGRWEFDHVNNRLEWSETIYGIFEIDRESFGESYDAFMNIVHPDDRELVDRAFKNSLVTKEPYEIEHRLLMGDGRIKWVIERCRTDYGDDGNPKRSVGIVQDITGRKLAAIALEESRQMLRMILDTIPVRVFWKDTQSRYLGCNLPFAMDAGFESPADLEGLDDYSMGWRDQAGLYRNDDQQVMKSRQAKLNYEEPQTTPGGGRIWLKTSKVPLTDIEGRVIGVLGTYEDITGRKKMEAELIEAKERAEESDRLKTAFLNNLSHEIRTPLNAIVGFSELLKKPEISNREINHYTEIIDHSSSQLLAIIDDIFDIAALEAGQVKVFRRSTNVNEMLSIIYEQFKLKSAGKNIDLVMEQSLPGKDAVITTDETKLSQIMANLVGNAVKFTKEGKVVFGCRKKDKQLEFYVRDSGIGIPPELHQKVFERFRRGEGAVFEESGGNGLGLFIAKSYVGMLGGKIWLTSSPGVGSEFYFTIPYEASSIETAEPGKEPEYLVDNRKKIVIAEDNPLNFLLLKEYLAGFDIELLHAANGEKAVEICRKDESIDLVLMDLKMPVMDGLQATGILKEIRPGLPVIALTAYAQSGDREKALQSGCIDYISKPVERGIFLSTLTKHLSGNKQL